MKLRIMLAAGIAAALELCLLTPTALAAPNGLEAKIDALTSMVERLDRVVRTQDERIRSLETENVALKTKVAAPAAPASTLGAPGRGSNLSAFNPEIGVIADITGIATESDEDEEGNDKFSLREMELIIGHDIDPYSRFDSTITLSDFEDVSVEEAYITHWGIPDVQARFGRVKPRVGVAAPQHRDQLDTVDMPLVVQEYFGVEGLSRSGLELSGYLPLPWESAAHELIAGVIEGGIGEGGTLFGDTQRRPTYYARLKNSADISEATNFTLGGTYLLGSADEDSDYEVNAFGVDATLRHNVDAVRKVKWQNEFYFQNRDQAAEHADEEGHGHSAVLTREEGEDEPFRETPWGFYSLLDYRMSPSWSLGARYDYVEPVNLEEGASDAEKAYSAFVTFHQSEFARWRFQYQRADLADDLQDDRFFLQATVAIGVHKHKLN